MAKKNRKNVNDTWKDVEIVEVNDDEVEVEEKKEEPKKMSRKTKIAIGALVGVGAVGAAFLTGILTSKKNYAEDTANDDDDGINEFVDKDIEEEV